MDPVCYWIAVFARDLLRLRTTPIGEVLGTFTLASLDVCNLVKWYWSVWTSLNRSLNAFLKLFPGSAFWVKIYACVIELLSESVSFKADICKQSDECRLAILAALSIFSMNSSSETDDWEPDHFGTSKIRDKSLCTVGVHADTRSFSLVIYAFDSRSCIWRLDSCMV